MKPTPEKLTIIFVEDKAGDALLLEEVLAERHPDAVLVVIDNGAKALHYFEVKAKVRDVPPPHCILLDTDVPIVTGLQLIDFLRGAEAYNDTAVYVFASEQEYVSINAVTKVSSESFLKKPTDWEGFAALSDLLMKSADAKSNDTQASTSDSKPEAHAKGELRLHRK
ncbi:MAG: response regulator [Planctomycetes bacterium]|nr:response regulator [Planctomycetota bacterium]